MLKRRRGDIVINQHRWRVNHEGRDGTEAKYIILLFERLDIGGDTCFVGSEVTQGY